MQVEVDERVATETHKSQIRQVKTEHTDPNQKHGQNGSLEIEDLVVYVVLANEDKP